MPKILNLAGATFGKLFVVRLDGHDQHYRMWLCRCECGEVARVRTANLTSGNTRSCGCLERAFFRDHGFHSKRSCEYRIWASMKQRCLNSKHPNFKDYGGRGIKICDQWIDSFAAFLAHVGSRPLTGKRMTIDRINNDGNYEPGNVRWATYSEQARNRRPRSRIRVDRKLSIHVQGEIDC